MAFDITQLVTPQVLNVKVTLNTGREFLMPFAPLTYHEYNEIGMEVTDPTPPKTGLDQNGKPMLNPLDPDYLKKRAWAAEERDFRRLARGLGKAGVDVPGDALPAKAAWLRSNLDAGAANVMLDIVNKFCTRGAAKIVETADSFQ